MHSTKLFNQAMDAMRRPGSRLIQTNYHGRPDFWIAPSGVRIEPELAKKLINHPQVIAERMRYSPAITRRGG